MLAVADRHANTQVDDALLRRIRAEFREMPGLCLTANQARRLWALKPPLCDVVLTRLVDDGFLRRTGDGLFVRVDLF